MITTDIDRLHRVVKGKDRGRGVGKTFAKCHEVLGHLYLGQRDIFCMITEYYDLRYILPMLEGILEEGGLKIDRVNKSTHEFFVLDSRIMFIAERSWDYRTRGYQGAMVYMRHWD